MEMYKLPDIIELESFKGNFNNYFEAVYAVFKNDFIHTRPFFRGTKLSLKRYPLVDEKEYTFYHFTHSGDIEIDRIPDFRRMERIAWPKPMINDSENPNLKVWKNIRRGKGGTKNRILILHQQERYLVVLDERKDYILPWTAYYLKSENDVNNKLKEYQNYINAENAKNS